ncbi:hypothetical protein CCHR01_17344, partial [Colletotrichum chrysophilum]
MLWWSGTRSWNCRTRSFGRKAAKWRTETTSFKGRMRGWKHDSTISRPKLRIYLSTSANSATISKAFGRCLDPKSQKLAALAWKKVLG